MKGQAPSASLYLAYAAWGQSAWYGHRLDSVLTPESAATVEWLFAGAPPKAILAGLPDAPRQMFNRTVLEAFDQGGRHWYLDAFAIAGLTDLTPRAPVRLYFGSKDIDVPPQEARRAAEAMRARGADAEAIDVGAVGHEPSMLAAAPRIFAWLGALELAEAARAQPPT